MTEPTTSAIRVSPHIDVFPIAIGEYRHYPRLDVDEEADRVVRLLHEFGGELAVSWETPMAERAGDAIGKRLVAWSRSSGDTLLYWIGHGWADGDRAALAHADSPRPVGEEGIPPERLAHHIAERETQSPDDPGWLIVVIDTCKSARFVQLLSTAVDRKCDARRVLLVGTSAEGSTTLGRFSAALTVVLHDAFGASDVIPFKDIWAELKRNLHGSEVVPKNVEDAVLRRRIPLPGSFAMPLDARATILQILATLSDDERRHFIPKAQGAELSEVSWYFEGRDVERQRIVDWLRGTHDRGLLIVTGSAGSGKSALLGDVLVRSRPELSRILAQHGLFGLLPHARTPPEEIFDVALHLVGLTLADVIDRLYTGLALDQAVPPDKLASEQISTLLDAVRRRANMSTILVDALDEAVEPLIIASALLRPLAAIPGVRIMVGTRRSTHEGPDQPESENRNLLDALEAPGADEVNTQMITIPRDPQAISRYVRRRLASALQRGEDDPTVAGIAVAIAAAGREFLFARLAVHEVLARPELLTDARGLTQLLSGDHRNLFAAAVNRLSSHHPTFGPLLHALGYAQGRGLPIRDGVWATFATALRYGTNLVISDTDIRALLAAAAPYLVIDTERGQTVYRLAHRTFIEHFTTDYDNNVAAHSQLTWACVEVARTMTYPLNPYVAAYTLVHAGAGNQSARNSVLVPGGPILFTIEGLDGHAMEVFLRRVQFGGGMPDKAAEQAIPLWTWKPTDSDRPLDDRPPIGIFIAYSVAMVPIAGRATLLASGGPDGTIRLWNANTGQRVGGPLLGHAQTIWSLAAVPIPGGRSLLASGDADGVVLLWDPAAGELVHRLEHDLRAVSSLAVVQVPGRETVLAIGDYRRGEVNMWNPISRAHISSFAYRGSGIHALTVVSIRDGRTLMASGHTDGTVRLRDLTTGKLIGRPLQGHNDVVRALATFRSIRGDTLLASSGNDGTVRLWDLTRGTTRTPVGDPLVHNTGDEPGAPALAALPRPNGHTLLASGGYDGMVRLWDPFDRTCLVIPIGSHVLALAVLEHRRIAVAGNGIAIINLEL
ncbi:AAA family ATPase [Nonomuraea basaltis]|uniref:AAA family ATPase n=1 Tax=Nonomuraea basaltis TaxID=2495887 RepID=UPI0014873F51|nr:AAA family ATPase [Nonomuraea basaltis]